ncbi:MAG: isochorismatase family protein, partial [Acetobacteraceae bacterium]
IVIRKGFRAAIDSYSAFCENDHATPTGLGGYLKERGIGAVTLCGLATDFCVAFSAIDARKHGLEVTVRLEACRGINLGGSVAYLPGQGGAAFRVTVPLRLERLAA